MLGNLTKFLFANFLIKKLFKKFSQEYNQSGNRVNVLVPKASSPWFDPQMKPQIIFLLSYLI